jgi:hypothetical protein
MIKIYLLDEQGQTLRVLRDPTIPRDGDIITSPFVAGARQVVKVHREYDEIETLTCVHVHTTGTRL